MIKEKEKSFDIISFSGRKESGKTELANICVEMGYEKKSFATSLKKLVSNLTGLCGIDELNAYKNKPIGVTVTPVVIDVLELETGFDREKLEVAKYKLNEKSTARDWLQVIGTDIIRACDPDWHVKKTLETLEEGKKYVFDDTRFPNELKALQEMGAECWYIIRTKTDNISNHPSENSLDYTLFDYKIIVNNNTLQEFKKRWRYYIEHHDISSHMRDWTIGQLFMNNFVSIPDESLAKFFVYKEFLGIKKLIPVPECLTINESKTGFIGDGGNPFITETWKKSYKPES
jgi:hypothetical protein